MNVLGSQTAPAAHSLVVCIISGYMCYHQLMLCLQTCKFVANMVVGWCSAFNYDKSSHNVWAFQDQASYLFCDFSGRNRLDSDTYSLVTILPWTPGSYGFIYFGSSIGLDCINGMRFFVSYYTCATCECARARSRLITRALVSLTSASLHLKSSTAGLSSQFERVLH